MDLRTGVYFDNFHTYNDWGFVLVSRPDTGTPAPRVYKQEIPGADGDLDLTEATTGEVKYSNRTMTFKFRRMINTEEQEQLKSEVYGTIHGKKVKIILDEDPDYYYTGRAQIKEFSRTHCKIDMTVTVDAEPYKYEIEETVIDVDALQSWNQYTQTIYAEDVSGQSWNTDFKLYINGAYLYDFTEYISINVILPDELTGRPIDVYVEGNSTQGVSHSYHRSVTQQERTERKVVLSIPLIEDAGIDPAKIRRVLVSGSGGCNLTATINNVISITLENGRKAVVPEIYSSISDVQLIHGGTTYTLSYGWQVFPDLLLKSGWNYLLFMTNYQPTVQIKFRRGWL